MLNEEFLSILVCPQCHGPVVYGVDKNGSEWLDCARCKVKYPVKDDIPVMLAEEAIPYSNASGLL